MTNTYMIQAWCVRPFNAYLDPVEADSPEQAIAIARRQPEKLLDAAEECNGQYPWDEFAAFDEHGKELLRVLNAAAHLRIAAPALLDALLSLKIALQHYRHWRDSMAPHLLAIAEAAIAKATPHTSKGNHDYTRNA